MRHNLSEIKAVIEDRRSIRPEDYSDRKVHRELIEALLDCARWAPTHGMTQPWHFKVFMEEGRKKLSDFMSDLYKVTTPEAEFRPKKFEKLESRPLQSSAVIAICMKRQESEKIPEIEEVEAVACAVQNMHLMCTGYGLGGFWWSGGVTTTQSMKDFLGLGEKDRCLGLFYVGYPAIEWPKGQRRPIEYFTDWIEE